jgi:bifunctional oligoribonuclease and PAP phosphatase NrnA
MIDLSSWTEAVPDAVIDPIRSARHVLAVGHENPDADTLGSTLAICRLVERAGGRATAVFADPIPPIYHFLPDVDRARTDPEPDADYDLLVVSDCGTIDRIGAVAGRHSELFERLPRVVLDHHASNDERGDADWIDPEAAATCEMTTLLALRLGAPLDEGDGALATLLMAGVVMDTATFAHPNTTPRTLAVSAALIEAGAPLSDISRRLYRSKPEAQLRLFGAVLARLAAEAGGRIVHASLFDADLAETGAIPAHSEGIIDLLAQAEEAEIAIVFKEAGPATRISVRTKPGGVDATVLTGAFGGGGHALPAGATILLPVAEARKVVLAEAERLVAAVAR